MNELLHIVRRVRRPLVVADVPPVKVGNVEPAKVETGSKERKPENDDQQQQSAGTDAD